MKKILLLMLSLVMVTTMMAEGVTPDEALNQARNFVKNRENKGMRPHRAPGTAASRLVMAKQVNGLYVFNVAKDEGFVIVSNDDRTEPILGYSDSGHFDPENMPENMRAWLQGYADQIAWLNKHPEVQNTIQKAPTKNPIGPLMVTEWDQGDPYNLLCPISSNEQCVTGCVATSMAQVMYFHGIRTGNPTQTTTEIASYTTSTLGLSIASIPSGTRLNWSNMLTYYDKNNNNITNDEKAAVATLMKACGASIRMDYNLARNGGSGAYSSDVPGALKKYFGYSSATRFVSRDDYSLGDWNNLIFNELAENRPVIYGGQSSGGGHSFVVDGYDGDELFHVNWGWGGHQNGYFLLSILNPGSTEGIGASSSNDGYSFSQNAIIGAKPDDGESTPSSLTFAQPSITGGNTIKFAKVKNNTGISNSFDFGIGIIDEDGNITAKNPNTNRNLSSGSYYTNRSFPINTEWGDGTYKVVPISRVTGTDEWIPDMNFYYFEVVINGNNITITPVGFALASAYNLSVEGEIRFTGSNKANVKQPVEATIRNTGGEFYGPLYLFASTTSAKGSYKDRTGITLLSNKTIDVQFNFTPTTASTYNIWITTDESGNSVIGQSTVTIETGGEVTPNVDLTATATIKNSDSGGYIIGNYVDVTITVTNPSDKTYQGLTQISFFEWSVSGNNTNLEILESDVMGNLTILPNSSVNLDYSYKNLNPNNRYSFGVVISKDGETWDNGGTWLPKTGSSTSLYNYPHSVKAGVTIYDTDGNKNFVAAPATYTIPTGTTAVDLRGNSTTTAVNWANNAENPNCLFILDAGATVPTGAGANIVKGGNAENITLQDGCDFYSPVTFTADNISYTRTFDTGLTRDYKNWTTIVLPFNVSEVTVDLTSQGTAYAAYSAYPIDWFHNAEETKKNFWVMEFGSEENGIVNFSHAAEIKAARPLLIAVPGAEWGSKNDLTNLPITFHGQNATVSGDFRASTSGDNYKMKGVVAQKVFNDIFVLNADGTAFTRQNSATIDAFRAYFEPTSTAATASMLTMAFGDGNQGETTALKPVFDHGTINQSNAIYDLQGRKLNGEPTQKGIYIVNGKKVIKK